MKKISEIFSEEELDYLSEYKSDLVPMDEPSEDDVILLKKPTLDQLIVQFLKQYEVNVEPRSVGKWNGWDTVATVGMLFAKEGSTSNIASTIFATNRSNQISAAAQDWGTWKRWVLDTKNKELEEFKKNVIESINSHNEIAKKEIRELIAKAELNNKKILKILSEDQAKSYFHRLNSRNELLGKIIICFAVMFFIFPFLFAVVQDNSRGKQRNGSLDKQILNIALKVHDEDIVRSF